ncbi:hypothetical protein LC609_27885 [Nostoc sp. XA013]|nr:hypothetical protein [Nostoc sp. XA013]
MQCERRSHSQPTEMSRQRNSNSDRSARSRSRCRISINQYQQIGNAGAIAILHIRKAEQAFKAAVA